MLVDGVHHSRVVGESAFEELVDHLPFPSRLRSIQAPIVDSLPKDLRVSRKPYCDDRVQVQACHEFGPQGRPFQDYSSRRGKV